MAGCSKSATSGLLYAKFVTLLSAISVTPLVLVREHAGKVQFFLSTTVAEYHYIASG